MLSQQKNTINYLNSILFIITKFPYTFHATYNIFYISNETETGYFLFYDVFNKILLKLLTQVFIENKS